MLYPTGAQIPFQWHFTYNKLGVAGLTVYVAIVRTNTDGSRTVVATVASNTAAIEVDSTNARGLYEYLLAGASTGTAGFYNAIARTTGTVDQQEIATLEIVGAAWVQTASGAMQAGSYTAPDNATIAAIATYVDTEVAAIKAKTDNLPSDPADASDIAASFGTISTTLSTIAGYIDTEVAAIKAKTDNLPSDPSSAATIATSFSGVSSTLATIAGYIDTEVAAIKAKTDNLPAAPASEGNVTAVGNAVATVAGYVDTEVGAIKAKTDQLNFTGTDVKATLDGETPAVNGGHIDYVSGNILGGVVGSVEGNVEGNLWGKILGSGTDPLEGVGVMIDAADVQSGLTAQGYSAARAILLDHLDADVSDAGGAMVDLTEVLADLDTLIARLTAGRALLLDNLALISAGGTTFVPGPVDDAGNIVITHGDAYQNVSGSRALEWQDSTGDWVPYVGKTAAFTARLRGSIAITATATFSVPDVGAPNTVLCRVGLTSAQTGALTSGAPYGFDVQVALTPGSVDYTPLPSGTMTVGADYTPASVAP